MQNTYILTKYGAYVPEIIFVPLGAGSNKNIKDIEILLKRNWNFYLIPHPVCSITAINHTLCDICRPCDSGGVRVQKELAANINHVPKLIMFECQTIHPTPEVERSIPTDSGPVHIRLCGIIYTGQSHFTSPVFDESSFVWKHNGMNDGREFHYKKIINLLTDIKQFEKNESRKIIYQI